MKDLLTTPILLTTSTPTLGINETKTQGELFIVIDQMINLLEPLGKMLEQQK